MKKWLCGDKVFLSFLFLLDSTARGPGFKGHDEAGVYAADVELHLETSPVHQG